MGLEVEEEQSLQALVEAVECPLEELGLLQESPCCPWTTMGVGVPLYRTR